MDTKAELERRLAEADEVAFALLFGSAAKGTTHAASDWDVGVYLSDALTAPQRFDTRLRLGSELDGLGKIDLVILNDAPPLLAHRALQGERILVKDPQSYVRFFVRTLAQSEDERYWRQVHAEARARRLEERRFGRP